MIPIRCFTCGKVIAHMWEMYESQLKSGVTEEIALDTCNLMRYCCRRMFLCHVQMIDQLLHFPDTFDKPYGQKFEKIENE